LRKQQKPNTWGSTEQKKSKTACEKRNGSLKEAKPAPVVTMGNGAAWDEMWAEWWEWVAD
jgi:hypothetical protein